MTSSGKKIDADADVLGVGLWVGQVKLGHPFLNNQKICGAFKFNLLTFE
jgi:hypothetical protein